MKKLQVSRKPWENSHFDEVYLASHQIDADQYGNSIHLITLKAKTASCWGDTNITRVITSGQSSLHNALNPSDHYFTLDAECVGGISLGASATSEIEFELQFVPPRYDDEIHHLSFYGGMLGGHNLWLLYQLTLPKGDDPFQEGEAPQFSFVKRYCYLQGTVIEK